MTTLCPNLQEYEKIVHLMVFWVTRRPVHCFVQKESLKFTKKILKGHKNLKIRDR